jgi:hypothetical protein
LGSRFIRLDVDFIRLDVDFIRLDVDFIRFDVCFIWLDVDFIRLGVRFIQLGVRFIRLRSRFIRLDACVVARAAPHELPLNGMGCDALFCMEPTVRRGHSLWVPTMLIIGAIIQRHNAINGFHCGRTPGLPYTIDQQ